MLDRRARLNAWIGGCATAVTLALTASCGAAGPFGCASNAQCDATPGGLCTDAGFCAFPDAGCDSGYRYHPSASAALANTCTAVEVASAGSSTTQSDDAGPSETTATVPSTTGSGDGVIGSGESTQTTGGTSTDDGGDVQDTGTTGSACGDHPCPCAVSLSSGHVHTCAVRTDGTIVCWGRNNFGQLGTGTTLPLFDDTPNVIAAPGVNFVDVYANNDHSCGMADSGDLWCWGRNNQSQSSPGLGPDFDPVPPTQDVSIDDPLRVSVSGLASCAMRADNTLRCWGDNAFGQLATPGPEPGPLDSGPHGAAPVLGVEGGTQHACLFTTDEVMCWGRNNFGQNGSGDPGMDLDTPTTVPLDVGEGVVALATGRSHTCAAVDGGAAVYCWGRNDCGQVDDASAGSCVQTQGGPIAYEPTAVDIPGTVVQLTARLDGTCARTDTGAAYCWGARQGYWLGTVVPFAQVVQPPASIIVLDELDEPLVDLSVGFQHGCGRAASGRVWCWGSEEYGQLGPNDPPEGMRTVEVDLQCP